MKSALKRVVVVSVMVIALGLIHCDSGMDGGSSGGDGRGACSSHGGVNCSAGPDSDGSVICNDGWRDSSVSYSDACN